MSERKVGERKFEASALAQHALTAEERAFALCYMSGKNQLDSYEQVFPKRRAELTAELQARYPDREIKPSEVKGKLAEESAEIANRPAVAAWMAFLEECGDNALRLAEGVAIEQMLVGSGSSRLSAAEAVLRRDEKKNARAAIDTWKRLMLEHGATVRRPITAADLKRGYVDVSLADVTEGKAQVALPKEARISILHEAGAPWSDDNPDARLSDVQKEFLGRLERFLFLGGGSGLGKSALGASFGFSELCIPGRRIAIVGDTYELAWPEFDYIHRAFMTVFGANCARTLQAVHTQTQHNMVIETVWGSSVRVFSLDRDAGQAILGKEFDLIIIGEASKVAHEIWEKKLRRALDRRLKRYGRIYQVGRAVGFTTPDGHLGMTSAIMDRVDERTQGHPEKLHNGRCPWAESIYFKEGVPVTANPDYDLDAMEAAKADLSEDAYNEQYLGIRVRKSGLVMAKFTRDKNLVPRPSLETLRRMRFGVGFDTGKNFGYVLAGIAMDGKIYALADELLEELSTNWCCLTMRESICLTLASAFGLQVPDDPLSDPARTAFLMTLFDEHFRERVELWFVDSNCQNKDDWSENLNVAVDWEKLDLNSTCKDMDDEFEEGKLFVTEDCDGLLYEIEHYRWGIVKKNPEQSTKRVEQKPIERNDHRLDAFRFIQRQLRKAGPLLEEPPPVTVEEAFQRQQYHEVAGHLYEKLRGLQHGHEGNFASMGELWREVMGD